MKTLKQILSILIFATFVTASSAYGDTIKFTTYISGPSNTYDRIQLYPQAVPASCDPGTMYVDSTDDTLYFCRNTGAANEWTLITGPWMQADDYIFPRDTVDNPDLKIGIGEVKPEFTLTLNNDGGILAKGKHGEGVSSITNNGSGSKLIWQPMKSAFRAGKVDLSNKIGDHSFATGNDNAATGRYAAAVGSKNTANDNSIVIGANNAGHDRSAVLGTKNNYSSHYLFTDDSYILGKENNTVFGKGTLLGYRNKAKKPYATSLGSFNDLRSTKQVNIGQQNFNSKPYSTSIGGKLKTGGESAVNIGYCSHAYGNNAIAIQNSYYFFDAFLTALNGCGWPGPYGDYAISLGGTANGDNSMSLGHNSYVFGDNSFAFGGGEKSIYNENSFVLGGEKSKTSGDNAIIFGDRNVAGKNSLAFGRFVYAKNNSIGFNLNPSVVFGNVVNSNNLRIFNDRVLIDQTAYYGPAATKLVVKGNIYATGSITSGSSRELKENIVNLETEEAIDTVMALEPVKFHYKAEESKDLHIGFIAEDVPEMVAVPDRKGVNELDVTASLTKVIQYQQKEIERRAKLLQERQKQIDEIRELIDQRNSF